MRFKNVKHSSYFIIKKMANYLLGNKISKLGLKIKICAAPLRNCSFYYYSISLFTELFCHFFVLYYLEWMSTLALKSLTASQFYFRCFFKNVCCDNWWHQIRLIHYVLFFYSTFYSDILKLKLQKFKWNVQVLFWTKF